MKSDRLLVLACVAGLFAAACADDPGGRSGVPTEPSFKPDKGDPTACDLVAGAIGDVFQGQAKNDFGDLLGLDDGTISAAAAFQGAAAISVAFNGRPADGSDDLSEAVLNPDFASWAGTLSKQATEDTGAYLTRNIFECAELSGFDPNFGEGESWADFEIDVRDALTQDGLGGYGSFAVRLPPDEGAVASPDLDNLGPFWYVDPDDPNTGAEENWAGVFDGTVLIYGFLTNRFATNEAGPIDTSYEWLVLPRYPSGFKTDVAMVTCQQFDATGKTGLKIQGRGTVLTSFNTDATFCTPPPQGLIGESSGLASRLARAVQGLFAPPPLYADATAVVGGGFGGFASKWSPFDLSDIDGLLLTYLNQPDKDQTEGEPLTFSDAGAFACVNQATQTGATPHLTWLTVCAQTDKLSPIEEICVAVDAVDNNGAKKALEFHPVDPTWTPCGAGTYSVETKKDKNGGGVAVFEGDFIFPEGSRGGYRLRIFEVDENGNPLGDFAPVDSDGFNVRPAN